MQIAQYTKKKGGILIKYFGWFLPQETEQGDHWLHEVTAQSGLANMPVIFRKLSGQVEATAPAQFLRSVVSTCGHFFRPMRLRNLLVLNS